MKFKVLPVNSDLEKNENEMFYLIEDNWNDWWEYKTLYQLYYKTSSGETEYIGGVKIGEKSMEEEQMRPNIPDDFDELEKDFFSLGEDKYYYENLNKLGDEIRDELLKRLRDIAFNNKIYNKVINLRVTTQSILRDKNEKRINILRNLALGYSVLTPYSLLFHYKNEVNGSVNTLKFYSEPNSNPPTNVQAIIGRNGVGKTYLINNLLLAIMNEDNPSKIESTYDKYRIKEEKIFENIMYISFSAFDGTEYITNTKKTKKRPSYTYIGLKGKGKGGKIFNKNTDMLRDELMASIWNCRKIPSKRARLQRAFYDLNVDPIFGQSEIDKLLKIKEVEKRKLNQEEKEKIKNDFFEEATQICKKFSSGHSIVLLTICSLIEDLEEKTLVLLDEPESHLHPPLLSTFVRILSNLLVNRNGMGIIATHSPVILQEIPKSCAYILDRFGSEVDVIRPSIETYGENINTLTKEVFSYELTNSGFHNTLVEVSNLYDNYDDALNHFNGNLGLEARAILRNLMSSKG